MDSYEEYIYYNGKKIQINEILARHERISAQIKKYFYNGEFHKLYNLYMEDFKLLPIVLSYHFKKEDEEVTFDSINFQEKHRLLKILYNILLDVDLPFKKSMFNNLILLNRSKLNFYHFHELEYKYKLCNDFLDILEETGHISVEIINNEELVTWIDINHDLGKTDIDYNLGYYNEFYTYNSFSEVFQIIYFSEGIFEYIDKIKSYKNFIDSNNPNTLIETAKNMIFANKIIKNSSKEIELIDNESIISFLEKAIEATDIRYYQVDAFKILGYFYLEIGKEKKAYEQFKNALNIDINAGVKLIYNNLDSKYGSKNKITLFNYNLTSQNLSFKNINIKKENIRKYKAPHQKSEFLFDKKWRNAEEVAIKYYKNFDHDSFWAENGYWEMVTILLFWNLFFNAENETNLYYGGKSLEEFDSDELNSILDFIFLHNDYKSFMKFHKYSFLSENYSFEKIYEKTKNRFEERLLELNNINLVKEIRKSFEDNFDKELYFTKIDWNQFTIDELIVAPLKLDKLDFLKIISRIILNFSQNRFGFPDLIVYKDNDLFFSEVKTKTDKLRSTQLDCHKFILNETNIRLELFFINKTQKRIKTFKNNYYNLIDVGYYEKNKNSNL